MTIGLSIDMMAKFRKLKNRCERIPSILSRECEN